MTQAPSPPYDAFAAIVGAGNAFADPADMAGYVEEQRGLFHEPAGLVVRPGSAEEVAAIVRLANETGTALVPQGGNTGLVGGQVPRTAPPLDRPEVIVALGRLNRIREASAEGSHLIAEAGVPLAAVQTAAEGIDRLFPLTLASEGSCQIGGNIASNAGGTAVLAYGNTRELVLGLEVVLGTGEVWNGLRTLHKDNTGYDLKQLFIGAEGTLGIITAAALKLAPRPRGRAVVMCGVASPADALTLLGAARDLAGGGLTAFELMPRLALELVFRHVEGARDPMETQHPWYVLYEVSSGRSDEDATETAEAIFAHGLEAELVADGVLAATLDQAEALWRLRHDISDVQKREGGSIKHDVAVPVARVPELLERGMAAVAARVPGVRPVAFGHLGDGNIHFNFSQPVAMEKAAFVDLWDEVNAIVHGIVTELGGTISAEHGIGQLKRDLLPDVKSAVEMDMMRRLKHAFDPNNVLNPGKIL